MQPVVLSSAEVPEHREYDSNDEDYIPEYDGFEVNENEDDTVPQETKDVAMQAKVPLEVRMKQAIDRIPPDIKTTLDEYLRGRFVTLKKIPNDQWI